MARLHPPSGGVVTAPRVHFGDASSDSAVDAYMRTQYGRGRDRGPIKITGGHLPGSVVW